jgi:hypothetical protein
MEQKRRNESILIMIGLKFNNYQKQNSRTQYKTKARHQRKDNVCNKIATDKKIFTTLVFTFAQIPVAVRHNLRPPRLNFNIFSRTKDELL